MSLGSHCQTALDLRPTVIAGAPDPEWTHEEATAPTHSLMDLQGCLQTHRGWRKTLIRGVRGPRRLCKRCLWGIIWGHLRVPEELWVAVVVIVVLRGPAASWGPLGYRGYLGTRPRDFG